MSKDTAKLIYIDIFVNQIHFIEMPIGVDYAVLDATVNLGVSGGAQVLHSKFGLKEVTKWDEGLLQVFRSKPEQDIIIDVRNAWIEKKRKSERWNKYGVGWINRNNKVLKRALKMVGVYS